MRKATLLIYESASTLKATRARHSCNPPIEGPFGSENRWFTGETAVPSFSRDEMRVLLQRDRSRDPFELDDALTVFKGRTRAGSLAQFLSPAPRKQN